ncbi:MULTISPECIES: hypothetical protein [Niastella]|uniref:Uncharacterized protein n=1 Tax=Niastella soli TaxID=2821487 RepID=A0ABS3YWH4_9BACT|nr:hypothetical protein [Niastella soli]MBO9201521.1 hypothetical protein [Niastella soli]
MDEKLKKLIAEFWSTAEKVDEKELKKITFTSGGRSSLHEVINTKEKADIFMTLLNSLSKKK